MRRNAVAVVLGVVLTILLFALVGYIELHFTAYGSAVSSMAEKGKDGKLVRRDLERFFALQEGSLLRSRWVYRPLIALCVGLVVGFVARGALRLSALIAITPFLILVWEREGWSLVGMMYLPVYLALALASAEITVRLARGPSQGD